jgi:hypothetical protein
MWNYVKTCCYRFSDGNLQDLFRDLFSIVVIWTQKRKTIRRQASSIPTDEYRKKIENAIIISRHNANEQTDGGVLWKSLLRCEEVRPESNTFNSSRSHSREKVEAMVKKMAERPEEGRTASKQKDVFIQREH